MSGQIKHQVFISSTYLDLQTERQAAVEAVLRAGHIPAGMELFAAEDRTQLDVIRAWIDESDIYMLILGSRYGSIEPASGWSYTEVEYRYALKKKKPTFAVILDEDAVDRKFKALKANASDNPGKLATFRNFVMTKVVRVVGNVDQIKLAVLESIQMLSRNNAIGGWERVARDKDSRSLALEIARLSAENSSLRSSAEKKYADEADGMSIREWMDLLGGMSFVSPEGKKMTLLEVLVSYSGDLASGVCNAAHNNSELEQWLYSPASELLSFGLMEHAKVPQRVLWSRLHLSAEGKNLVRLLLASSSNANRLETRVGKSKKRKIQK